MKFLSVQQMRIFFTLIKWGQQKKIEPLYSGVVSFFFHSLSGFICHFDWMYVMCAHWCAVRTPSPPPSPYISSIFIENSMVWIKYINIQITFVKSIILYHTNKWQSRLTGIHVSLLCVHCSFHVVKPSFRIVNQRWAHRIHHNIIPSLYFGAITTFFTCTISCHSTHIPAIGTLLQLHAVKQRKKNGPSEKKMAKKDPKYRLNVVSKMIPKLQSTHRNVIQTID